MRESLRNLIESTICFQFKIPSDQHDIGPISISTSPDDAFHCKCEKSLAEIIYNSVIEYSFNSFEIDQSDFSLKMNVALKTKLKYHEDKGLTEKKRYGFYGEVLLHSVLCTYYDSKPAIARGYFYNPLENSETKGYDSYHLVETKDEVQLWFGEVKFRETLDSCVKSAFEGLDKALTDEYLEQNFLAIYNFKNSLDESGDLIKPILESWETQVNIKIAEEIKKHKMKLVYPILLVYSNKTNDYIDKISNGVKRINQLCQEKSYSISIDYELFFILMPIEEVGEVKKDVIEWIESKKPLLS